MLILFHYDHELIKLFLSRCVVVAVKIVVFVFVFVIVVVVVCGML